jgi:hypothetical protein
MQTFLPMHKLHTVLDHRHSSKQRAAAQAAAAAGNFNARNQQAEAEANNEDIQDAEDQLCQE